MRLRRSDLSKPGYTRRRAGKGFSYRDTRGRRITDAATLDRIRALVIPPAWREVWISPDPHGHIQATGIDAAGRKQYRYHTAWREARDQAKFDHTLEVAERLPELRDRLCRDLTGGRGLSRERVLAAIVRMLDMGMFRIGGDQYAARDEDPSYGLSTLRPEHVRGRGGCVVVEYPGKSGVERASTVEDGEVCSVLRDLKRRRRGQDRLFAYWNPAARRWQEVRADMINEYLREASGSQMTAKDFRTWHGTVKAAEELAEAGPQPSETRRKKVVSQAIREVADLLGNTPAVARSAYVDPRVIERFHEGEVVNVPAQRAPSAGAVPDRSVEEEVVELLTDD